MIADRDIYYSDATVTLLQGDSLATVEQLPSGMVDCIVTSPPYYGQRVYLDDRAGELGAEKTPDEYVDKLRALFAELRRVLAPDGTLWLNLGDGFSNGTRPKTRNPNGGFNDGFNERCGKPPGARKQEGGRPVALDIQTGLPAKSLLGMPWRVAFALQADGWILRNAIVWHKRNAMPEPVKDRLSTRYEHIFMFSKSTRYWFDLDAIRVEPISTPPGVRRSERGGTDWDKAVALVSGFNGHKGGYVGTHPNGKNPGDVWDIVTRPFRHGHFAAFPPALPERCIRAGCKPGGMVLDPFHGSGTTGLVAEELGRRYVGVDISAEYLALSLRTRLGRERGPWSK